MPCDRGTLRGGGFCPRPHCGQETAELGRGPPQALVLLGSGFSAFFHRIYSILLQRNYSHSPLMAGHYLITSDAHKTAQAAVGTGVQGEGHCKADPRLALAWAKGHSLEGEGLREEVYATAHPILNAILGGRAVKNPAVQVLELFHDPGNFFLPHFHQTGTACAEPEGVKGRNERP